MAGRGSFILLAGEPGIGKSELARLAADHAEAAGMPVHWGFCWEAGGAPAYWPWMQALRSLAGSVPGEKGAGLEQRLSRLFPEDAVSAEAGDHLLADQAVFQLMNTVLGLLSEGTRDTPCLLILEDLHAADADTLGLLNFISPHVKTLPLVLIGTFRETEAGVASDASSLWQAARAATLLRPGRFDQSQVLAYLERAAPSLASDGNAALLYRTTEGNPLFLVELVDLLLSGNATFGQEMQLPDSMYQVVRGQVSRLPVSSQELLQKAAVLGRSFDTGQLAAFSGAEEAFIAEVVQSPECQVFLGQVSGDTYRFSHIVYRDVLHQDLSSPQREKLHRARARQLRDAAESGHFAPWSEIATHLEQAGPGNRQDAIEAWREAAELATRRLALVDACDCLRRAVDIFGQGPVADPDARCRLLLDLAEAELRAGHIDGGRSHCREAYRIAETLADPALISRAALVYGSAYVAGQVDTELAGFLEHALDALPDRSFELRARIQGRLAAALQPASDPAGPMEMAREAIGLARKSGVETVLFETLRSAISALMDFAPVDERLALNREYVRLADRRGDIPEQFRGNMRLLVDAVELADPAAFDEAINACDAIAERIGLPHYRWKVASAKAMRDMLHGRLDEARRHMERAAELGREASDDSERRINAIQQFSGCRLWMACDLEKTRDLVSAMQATYAGLPEMRYFFKPFEALALLASGSETQSRQVLDDSFFEDILRSGDRTCQAILAELALQADHLEHARRLYQRLLPSVGQCLHWGLLGMTWDGPMDRVLGLLAAALGHPDEARTHFENALRITRRMSALPFTSLVLRQYAEFLEASGAVEESRERFRQSREIARDLGLEKLLAAEPTQASPETVRVEEAAEGIGLEPDGEVWKMTFPGRDIVVKDSKGVRILGHLVSHPGREFHVLELNNLDAPPAPDQGDAGPLLDDEARRQYRQRLDQLSDELEQAEELGDSEGADRAREEMDMLGKELSRAFGLGGRPRHGSSAAERARVNVRRRIKDAITRISERFPEAGKFLDLSVKTGNYCKFDPP